MKRALIIAYFSPPIASVGTLRTLKFVKYLDRLGWQCIVLTVDPKYEPLEPKDESLLAQLPESTVVIRTRAWSFLRRHAHGLTKADGAAIQQAPGPLRKLSLHKRTALRVRDWLMFPDRWIGWLPFALWHGLAAIRKHNPDVIYTSAPPFTGTLVGLACHALSGKPLVSDLRDPWIGDKRVRLYSGRRLRLARWLEQKVFENSARIINVTATLSLQAQARAPHLSPSQFSVIYNGFDPEDFSHLCSSKRNDEFRVAYTGSFYRPDQEPRCFLEALALLAKECPLEFRKMRAYFVGEPQWGIENAGWLERLGLTEHVRFLEFRPHEKALQFMVDADVLLVLGSVKKTDAGVLTGKLPEYLGTNRPILALAHEGELARVVRESGVGVVVNPEDPEEIAATLLQMHRDIRAGRFPTRPNADLLKRYDRRAQAKQLAALFDEASAQA